MGCKYPKGFYQIDSLRYRYVLDILNTRKMLHYSVHKFKERRKEGFALKELTGD